MDTDTPKTYADAIRAGYREIGQAYQRGYVSRRTARDTLPIRVAGGNRRGELFVLAPCFRSTQYAVRVYLAK